MNNYGHRHQRWEKSRHIRKGPAREEKVQLLVIGISAGTIENEKHKEAKEFPPILTSYIPRLPCPATHSSILQYNLQESQLINRALVNVIAKYLSK